MRWALATSALPACAAIGPHANGIRHSSCPRVNSDRASAPRVFVHRLSHRLALIVLTGTLAACSENPAIPAHLRIAGAEPERGRALVHSYGCGTCHRVDGIRGARGTVGPPLDQFAQRSVVAGFLPNTPRVLVAWLIDPPALDPRTAMPNVGLDESQARDIAGYLYTLGSAGADVYPRDPPLDLSRGGGPALETLRRSVAPQQPEP